LQNLDSVQALNRDELLTLLATAKQARESDWLLMVVALNHGLRVSEVTRITPHDIRGGQLTVRRLKGSKTTDQPLVEHQDPLLSEAAALTELARRTPKNQPLFKMHRSTAWRRIQRHAKAAGISERKASVRSLKHTLATLTIDRAGVKAVQLQLGHVSAKNTLVYTDISTEEAAARVRGAL
jgi:integrase